MSCLNQVESFTFAGGSGLQFRGSAKNLQLSTTAISISPLDNAGVAYSSGSMGSWRIVLESSLSVDLYATVKNLTTNTYAGPLTISSGNTTAQWGGVGVSFSTGDSLSLILSVSSGDVVIPQLHWYI